MLHNLCRQITFVPIWYFARLKSQKHGIRQLLVEMPRSSKHVEEGQKERIRIKEKNSKYSPGTVNIQVLGSGATGSPASAYLFTDQTRYLFNCGEGTQRLAHEHKIKLARLEHIFMTRTCWECVGGLPGLSLTVQDAGVPNLTLHGPVGLAEMFSGMRKFVVLKHLRVDYVNCEQGGRFEDQVMDVTYIPLIKTPSIRSSDINKHWDILKVDETDYYAHERSHVLQSPGPAISGKNEEENVVMCYACKLKPRPGMLNLEKCVEFGVPPGPLLGQLKNGFDVILENGTTVKADDVRGPTDPGSVFIFIDIPNEDYLKSLDDSSQIFEKYQAAAVDPCYVASVVVHFSPPSIFETKLYQQFINKFSPSTKHLVLNSDNKFSGYLAVHRIQWQLNLVDQDIFPIIKENFSKSTTQINDRKKIKLSSVNIPVKHLENPTGNNNDNLCLDPVSTLTCYHLRPRKGLDRSMEPVLRPEDYINESKAIEGFSQSLLELEKNYLKAKLAQRYNRSREFPKIIFLGTGSCIPNKTRNVSAILMQTMHQSFMLLDCGEGTWGQIIRFFGQEEAVQVLRNLKVAYISHLHADHHIGLLGIFKARADIFGQDVDPLILLAPNQIQSWLTFYDYKIESIQNNYQLVPNGDLLTQPLMNPNLSRFGISSIRTCLVRHCPHAFGVSFQLNETLRSGKIKITYSGDTMPCEDLVELGMNSTILIHEATMEDDLINEAKMKMHSTISQAVEQGVKMNAQYTILTHFSQRYAKLPRIATDLACNIGIAFDNMQLTVPDLEYMHMMYPTLKILFSEHCDEMEQKAFKRALKNGRRRIPFNE